MKDLTAQIALLNEHEQELEAIEQVRIAGIVAYLKFLHTNWEVIRRYCDQVDFAELGIKRSYTYGGPWIIAENRSVVFNFESGNISTLFILGEDGTTYHQVGFYKAVRSTADATVPGVEERIVGSIKYLTARFGVATNEMKAGIDCLRIALGMTGQ